MPPVPQTRLVRQSFEAGLLVRGQYRRLFAEYLFSHGQDPRAALQEVKGGLGSVFYFRFQGSDADQRELDRFLNSLYELNATVEFVISREQRRALEERAGSVLEEEFGIVFQGHGFFKGKTYTVYVSREGARWVADVLDAAGYETDQISAALGGDWRSGKFARSSRTPSAKPPTAGPALSPLGLEGAAAPRPGAHGSGPDLRPS